MSTYAGIEIYSLEDIVINTALGKDVVLNGKVYNGNGIGIKWDKFKDRLTVNPENIYSTKDVIIRTDKGKSVIINGTAYPSTTGIARIMKDISQLYQNGINWYCTDNIFINIAPGQKVIINDVEITGTPDVPSTATVTGLVPNTAQTNSGVLVDVNGTGFTAPTVIQVNGAPVQTTYVSATKLTTNYFGADLPVAIYTVGVRKTGEVPSNTMNFALTADVDDPSTATVGSLSPNTAAVNSGQLVTINGTGFTAQTAIQADGSLVQTSYVSPTALTSTYFGTIGTVKTTPVGVKKPGELLSNTVNFSTTAAIPTPTITNLSPTTSEASSGQLVTVNGTGFVPQSKIQADTVDIQTTYVSATVLTTTYLGGYSTSATFSIRVQNPGPLNSNAVSYVVTFTAPPPEIDSLNPSTFAASSGTLVTINGSNFVAGCAVMANGVGVQTTRLSASQVTTTYLGTVASAQTVAITVKNPDNQVSNSIDFIVTAVVVGPPTSGLVGWWDADDASTITFNTGVAVSQWRDKSGLAHHAFPDAGLEPWRDAIINGKPAIRFGIGAPQHFFWINSFASTFTAGEIFVVTDLIIDNSGAPLGKWGTPPDSNHFTFSGTIYEGWGSSVRHVVGAPGANLLKPAIYNLQTAPGSYIARLNGTTIFTTAANTVAFTNTNHQICAINSIDGSIGEVIMYNRILSAGERTQIENYLTTKWFTPISGLPVSAGLTGWYDATYLSLADNAEINVWHDKSPENNGLYKVATGPIFKTNIQNGKPVVRFNGTTTRELLGGFTTNQKHIFVVAKYNLATFADYQGLYTDNVSNYPFLGTGGGTNWLSMTGTYHKDGVLDATKTGPMTTWNVMSLSTPTGWNMRPQVGIDRSTPARIWNGDVAEIIIYDRELNTTERQQVEAYLKTKWGTP